ncbi:MAG: dephospho-CoA kinase [Brevinematales bacterium]|nr:dephospho-CoA kinase [Brevinematales bacterium]
MKKKYVIGIFGKTGSGKSTVSKILSEKYGFYHIDVDKIGHIVLEKLKDKILANFGKGILTDGKIDRKKLGEIVFKNRNELYKLNSIVHPEIKKLTYQEIKNTDKKYVVIDAALLFEIGLDEYCDFLIMVESNENLIYQRNNKNRNWDFNKTADILKSQEYLDILKGKADFIIYNNENETKLLKQIEFLVHIIF